MDTEFNFSAQDTNTDSYLRWNGIKWECSQVEAKNRTLAPGWHCHHDENGSYTLYKGINTEKKKKQGDNSL